MKTMTSFVTVQFVGVVLALVGGCISKDTSVRGQTAIQQGETGKSLKPRTAEQTSFRETFAGGTIDSSTWVTGGRKRGWNPNNPSDIGNWTFSTTATDGCFRARVQGPSTGNTYGAEAWIRSTHDFNDGKAHVINFTWGATSVEDDNYALYLIQLTGGIIPDTNNVHCSYDGLAGTYDLLKQPDSHDKLHCGAILRHGQSKTTWSMLIAPSGNAKLYDRSDGSGKLLGQESLDTRNPWYFRLMVVGATSAGFPAKDTSFMLYEVAVKQRG